MDEFLRNLALLIIFIASNGIKNFIDKRKKKQEEIKKKEEEARQKAMETEKAGYPFALLVDAKVKIQEHLLMQQYRPSRMFVFHLFDGEVTLARLHLLASLFTI